MSVYRRKHTRNFTTIGNSLFNDKRLYADELGIICYLLSRPHDWEIRRPQLAKQFRIGRLNMRRIIRNLIQYGWIVPIVTRLENKQIHIAYEIRDEPAPGMTADQARASLEMPRDEAGGRDPEGGEPSAAPCRQETTPGSIYIDLLNTDSLNTDSTKAGARAFSDVYESWPSEHVLSHSACESAHLSLSDADKEAAYKGVKPYIDECRQRRRKICDLATYYRERRWERFSSKLSGTTGQFAAFRVYSANWHRWREYKIARGESVSYMETSARSNPQGMWTEASPWPPAMPAKSAQPAAVQRPDEAADFTDL